MHLVLISCTTLNDHARLQNLVLGEDYFLGRHYLHKIKGIYKGTHNWHYWRVTFKKLSTTQSRSHQLNSTLPSNPYHIVCSPKQKSSKDRLSDSRFSQRPLTDTYADVTYIIILLLNKDSVLLSQDSDLQLSQNTAATCFDLLRDSKDLSLGCFRPIHLFLYLVQITGHREGLQTCYISRHTCYRCLQTCYNEYQPSREERNPR